MILEHETKDEIKIIKKNKYNAKCHVSIAQLLFPYNVCAIYVIYVHLYHLVQVGNDLIFGSECEASHSQLTIYMYVENM